MEIEPLIKYSSLVFKLPVAYISYLKIYADIINIDDYNDTFTIYNNQNLESSIKLPHKLYTSLDEIMSIIISELKEKYNVEATFNNQTFKIVTENIYIKFNNFTKFIQLNEIDNYFNNNEYYINSTKLNYPSEFYIILTPSIDNFVNDSKSAFKTISLVDGYNQIAINFQNEYSDLYLIVSSDCNKYPLKYNKLSYLYTTP